MLISIDQLKNFDIEKCVNEKVTLLMEQECFQLLNGSYFEKYSKVPVPFSHLKEDASKLDKIWDIIGCHKCPSLRTQNKAYPNGNLNAKIFVIGEAPGIGKLDATTPENFLMWANGPSTDGLKYALSLLNILHQCWFSNLLRCSIPDNRPGNHDEFSNCFDKLKKEIEIINPKILVLLGKRVSQFIATKERELANYMTISVYHPAYFQYKNLTSEDYAIHLKEKMKEVL